MTLHIMVEGPSELAFFDGWLKKLKLAHAYRVHAHQGKGSLPAASAKANNKMRGLLDQLPFKLRAFASTLDVQSDAILILVDADDDDPSELTEKIAITAKRCAPQLRIEISVATEEMEAFYLGDLRALRRAYPEADMKSARAYVPDSICGTWERFGEIINDDGGNKVAWAEAMGPKITTIASQSRSPSFQVMLGNISKLNPAPPLPSARRRYHHQAKSKK